MAEYGLLGEVTAEPRGSELTASAAISDTELVIDYSGDFDTDGGTLDLNGARLAYVAIIEGDLPEDPDTLVLAEPLLVAGDEGDSVLAVVGAQIATDYYAQVTMSGDGDTVKARIPYNQIGLWPVGQYDPPVPVTLSDDLLWLVDAPGQTPSDRASGWNTDEAIAAADDTDVTIPLSFVPNFGTLHVRQNGNDLAPDEWVLGGQLITVAPGAELVIRAGDRFTTAYFYDGAAAGTSQPPPAPDVVYSDDSYNLDSWTMPAGAADGDYCLAIGILPTGASVSALNGYTFLGETASVTHTGSGSPLTYRLGLWAIIKPVGSSPVPTLTTVAADSVCALVSFSGASTAFTLAFGTVADDDVALSPTISPRSDLRVYASISNHANLSVDSGTIQINHGGSPSDIQLMVTTGTETAQVEAQTDGPLAGWMLAAAVLA